MEDFLDEYRSSGLGCDYMMVLVSVNDSKFPEIIINTKSNFEEKMKYYRNAYSNDLTLKSNPNVRIVGYAFFDDFDYLNTIISGIERSNE